MKTFNKVFLLIIAVTFTVCAVTADDSTTIIKGTCGSGDISLCAKPLTLAECYKRALRQSETIAITADRIRETEGRFLQALSIMMPHIYFLSKDSQEEKRLESPGLQSFAPTKKSERSFYVTQNLFTGFKAFEAIKASGQEKKQRTKEKERAEQLLLVDVSNSFYLLMETREDQKALRKIESALTARVKELRGRERLGRSRPSEVVNAKAQLYSVKADLEIVRNQEILARQILEFLVGGPIGDVEDISELPRNLMEESYYVSMADGRPDVQATKFGWDFAKSTAKTIDSDFLPTVNVDGNYYTQRSAFYKGVDWNINLSVSVPIFDGGYTLGRSKEAWMKADESRLDYQRTRRKAPYDIKDAYTRLNTALEVHAQRRRQYATAKLNYFLQRKDYSRSLVSNLDVLASIQTLQDSQRSYIHSLYEAKRQYWQLRVAVGKSITETLYDAF